MGAINNLVDYQLARIEALERDRGRLIKLLHEVCDKDCTEEYRSLVLDGLIFGE